MGAQKVKENTVLLPGGMRLRGERGVLADSALMYDVTDPTPGYGRDGSLDGVFAPNHNETSYLALKPQATLAQIFASAELIDPTVQVGVKETEPWTAYRGYLFSTARSAGSAATKLHNSAPTLKNGKPAEAMLTLLGNEAFRHGDFYGGEFSNCFADKIIGGSELTRYFTNGVARAALANQIATAQSMNAVLSRLAQEAKGCGTVIPAFNVEHYPCEGIIYHDGKNHAGEYTLKVNSGTAKGTKSLMERYYTQLPNWLVEGNAKALHGHSTIVSRRQDELMSAFYETGRINTTTMESVFPCEPLNAMVLPATVLNGISDAFAQHVLRDDNATALHSVSAGFSFKENSCYATNWGHRVFRTRPEVYGDKHISHFFISHKAGMYPGYQKHEEASTIVIDLDGLEVGEVDIAKREVHLWYDFFSRGFVGSNSSFVRDAREGIADIPTAYTGQARLLALALMRATAIINANDANIDEVKEATKLRENISNEYQLNVLHCASFACLLADLKKADTQLLNAQKVLFAAQGNRRELMRKYKKAQQGKGLVNDLLAKVERINAGNDNIESAKVEVVSGGMHLIAVTRPLFIVEQGVTFKLGRIRISLNMTTFAVTFTNLDYRFAGYFSEGAHPHASNEEQACLGRLGDSLSILAEQREIDVALDAIMSYLETVDVRDVAGKSLVTLPVIDPATGEEIIPPNLFGYNYMADNIRAMYNDARKEQDLSTEVDVVEQYMAYGGSASAMLKLVEAAKKVYACGIGSLDKKVKKGTQGLLPAALVTVDNVALNRYKEAINTMIEANAIVRVAEEEENGNDNPTDN